MMKDSLCTNLIQSEKVAGDSKKGRNMRKGSLNKVRSPRFGRISSEDCSSRVLDNKEHLPGGFFKIKSKNLDVLVKKDYYGNRFQNGVVSNETSNVATSGFRPTIPTASLDPVFDSQIVSHACQDFFGFSTSKYPFQKNDFLYENPNVNKVIRQSYEKAGFPDENNGSKVDPLTGINERNECKSRVETGLDVHQGGEITAPKKHVINKHASPFYPRGYIPPASCEIMSNVSVVCAVLVCGLLYQVHGVPFIVQSLSSKYAIILGGYGYSYQELEEVEVVRHEKVCHNVISDVPVKSGRFLGDASGLAEFVNDSVIYCRHDNCWKLNVLANQWNKISSFLVERQRAASAAVGDQMIVLGGRDVDGTDIVGFEVYDEETDAWVQKPEWEMAQGRYSFCSVPVNDTALLIIGGYSSKGALSSVELLDTQTGRWDRLADLPKPRYGHACLMMELHGQEGILISGGALTGSDVQFLDLKLNQWKTLAPLTFRTDGHKMVLVEGIPTVFSWERIEQFDGKEWRATDLRLSRSRSAFAVTSVPGHLISPTC